MRVRPPLTIVLFDIDGTLIRTGRAGSRAMNRAFEDVFGIAGAFDGVEMAGRTDRWILADAASRVGVDLGESAFRRFRDQYFVRLREALEEPAPGKEILPGVRPLLEALGSRAEVLTALLTGNCEEGARIKLDWFALWTFFRCGAYGDEAVDRNHLFDVAMRQAEACGVARVRPADVIVVGDTVFDVACAKAAGARSIAVATGPSDETTLLHSGADIALRDLSDTEGFLRLVGVQI